MQKITPHLWFDKEAKEATEFYTSLFSDSKITNIITLHNTEGSFKVGEMRYTAADQVDLSDLKRWLKKSKAIQWDYKILLSAEENSSDYSKGR